MFDFKGANKEQIEAIKTTEGPLLISAGPGTGKTFTLVNRVVYLIKELKVEPDSILVATFTEKAAKELITRISKELLQRDIEINLNDMYIGTFHSICLRILKEQIEYTGLRKNFTVLDSFDQQYLVYQNLYRFKKDDGILPIFTKGSVWYQVRELCQYINNLREELIEVNDLMESSNAEMRELGECVQIYEELIASKNVLDFTSIQTETYELLIKNINVLDELQQKINYIMVDEYQDTNYIQNELVFLLGKKSQNVCVVGDDDQGLYRFRGATIRNIFKFPDKFEKESCKHVRLIKNYRSDSKIIDFYNEWMDNTAGRNFEFDWGKFRYHKRIEPIEKSKIKSETVFKVAGKRSTEEWYSKLLSFIYDLRDSETITDYNQIAFLARSVKNEKVKGLARFFEKNGVGVYSPRSNLFFERKEVKLIIGAFLMMFPNYVRKLDGKEMKWLSNNIYNYYAEAINHAVKWMQSDKTGRVKGWIQSKGLVHTNLNRNTDYAFSEILYEMFQFEPFKNILSIDLEKGIVDQRQARNLALFSELLGKFEFAENVNVFTPKNINPLIDKLFSNYLRFLLEGGIGEYEDDSEYAPSGCVSFLTIHQSKGMEFPIVIVDSLGSVPRKDNNLINKVLDKFEKDRLFEPEDKIKFFDFWRLYYTAFSRTQDMLVLTCDEKHGRGATPSKYFEGPYNSLIEFASTNIDLKEFDISEIKDVNIKESYSFTSDISVYNNCSLQYKFFKELGFTEVRVGSTTFGMLVHQTIEDIHKAVLRGESEKINVESIEKWFYINYNTIVQNQRTYLGQGQLNVAFKQIMRYVDRRDNDWSHLKEAEVDVSLVKEDYILNGQIDLIEGHGNTLEIIDFKSEKKPNLVKDRKRIEHYKKQLEIYAYLVEKQKGLKVSKMNLYYTGAGDENPVISFPKNDKDVSKTVQEFDAIVENIKENNYSTESDSQLICSNCDMRYYCGR